MMVVTAELRGGSSGGGGTGAVKSSKNFLWPSSQQGLCPLRGGSARFLWAGGEGSCLLWSSALKAGRTARTSLSGQRQGLWVPDR